MNILIISGPSGSGKSSLAHEIAKRKPETYEVVKSVTTRQPREEQEFYTFVSKETFMEMEKADAFLESNFYQGSQNFYGTPKESVFRIQKEGKIPILDIDVNGRKQIIESDHGFDCLSIFVCAPAEILYQRLVGRSETHKSALKRIKAAIDEIDISRDYDAFILNFDFETTLSEIDRVIHDETFRPKQDVDSFIENTIAFINK